MKRKPKAEAAAPEATKVEVAVVERDKVVATVAIAETLQDQIYKVYGTPIKPLCEVKVTKNKKAYAVGFVLAAAGLKPNVWPQFVNLLDVASGGTKGQWIAAVVKEVAGEVQCNATALPYCEGKHHHIFMTKRCGSAEYANAMETVALMRTGFGAELCAAMGKVTGVAVTPERLEAYLAEYETANK